MKNSPITSKDVIRYYWQCMWRYPRYNILWLLAVPLTVLFGSYLPPLLLARAMNMLTQHTYSPHDIWSSFGTLFVLYAASVFMSLVGWRLVDFAMWNLEQRIQQDIAETVFRRLQLRSIDFHANHFGGSLVSQTNKLMGGYVRFQDTTFFQVYPMLSGIVLAIIILWERAGVFTLGLAAFIVVYLIIALLLMKPISKHLVRFAKAESKQTGYLADAITNAPVIKSFARLSYEIGQFHTSTENSRSHLRRFARAQQWQISALGGMHRIITSFAFVMAVLAVAKFHASIGVVFLIFAYTNSISDQLFNFSNQSLRTYNRAFSDAKEMLKILREPIEINEPTHSEPRQMHHGAIQFKDVRFAHQDAHDAIFQNFSLDIKPGEKIGLVGHSGSGKTTFTRLLLRYSDIQAGTITIDGQNITAVTQDDLHTSIAYVPQEPLLFHRSIRENIGYGDLGANQQEIEQAAQLAHAHEFIKQLPHGYDTLVGERGVKLSGGQRQRVVIARAMLKDAPILVLDEATSALDSESEVLIQDALWKLMEGRTAIVIAHRLSTIQKMDRIIVLEEGHIAEEGTHKELLRRGGTYAKLWAHQSGGFIDE